MIANALLATTRDLPGRAVLADAGLRVPDPVSRGLAARLWPDARDLGRRGVRERVRRVLRP